MFNVGDRVRLISNGVLGTIVSIGKNGHVKTIWDDGVSWVCMQGELRLIELEYPKPSVFSNQVNSVPVKDDGLFSIDATVYGQWSDLNSYKTRKAARDGYTIPILRYDNSVFKKCECGCSAVGSSNHSDYCPLHE